MHKAEQEGPANKGLPGCQAARLSDMHMLQSVIDTCEDASIGSDYERVHFRGSVSEGPFIGSGSQAEFTAVNI
jgi:hypothetical protein